MSHNKYFDGTPSTPEHPRIRAWKSFQASAGFGKIVVEIRRERHGLSYLPARLFVTFHNATGQPVRLDEAYWELELDAWLIDHAKARAMTTENESLRFCLVLQNDLKRAQDRFGADYFNSVFVFTLRKGPFASDPAVSSKLSRIHEYRAAGGSAIDCEESIDAVLTNEAHRLLGLYDERRQGERILANAIAQYLDDRYHLSSRGSVGF